MTRPVHHRLFLVLLVAAVAFAAWQARRALHGWTTAQIAQRHQRTIDALSEQEAAAFVRRLAGDGDQWLTVFVAALADRRPEVASAASVAVNQRVAHWRQLPAENAATRAAELARLLAPLAANLSPELQQWAGTLAQQLLTWPSDSRRTDAAQFIADCETLVRSMPTEPVEIRVAKTEAPPNPRPDQPTEPRPLGVPEATQLKVSR